MTNVSDQDRVALLVQGIAVLSVEPERVCVSGAYDDHVRAVVAARLDVDASSVCVSGAAPRELRPWQCLSYVEREPGRLQLRYVVRGEEQLVDVAVAEDDEAVAVLGTVCTSVIWDEGDSTQCLPDVYLRGPLDGRRVIDGFDGEEVPYKNVFVELQRMMNGD